MLRLRDATGEPISKESGIIIPRGVKDAQARADEVGLLRLIHS
jgi:hypothetical protein